MNSILSKKQKKKWGEEKAEKRNEWHDGNDGQHGATSAGLGDSGVGGLYCVETTGTRLNRQTRGPGKLFENLTWLTADEAAEYLRLPSVGMLRVLVCKREVPFHKLGRRLRFKRVDLDRLLETSRKGGF